MFAHQLHANLGSNRFEDDFQKKELSNSTENYGKYKKKEENFRNNTQYWGYVEGDWGRVIVKYDNICHSAVNPTPQCVRNWRRGTPRGRWWGSQAPSSSARWRRRASAGRTCAAACKGVSSKPTDCIQKENVYRYALHSKIYYKSHHSKHASQHQKNQKIYQCVYITYLIEFVGSCDVLLCV